MHLHHSRSARGGGEIFFPIDRARPRLTRDNLDLHRHDPAGFRIAYVWVKPGRLATELRIQLAKTDDGNTRSHIRFRYTGLSEEGNREVESYDRTWFEAKMRGWETAINHYLETGKMIPTDLVAA